MFDNLYKEKDMFIEQIETYYYFLKGYKGIDEILDNLKNLTTKEKKFFKEIKVKIDKIELIINTELF